MRARTIIYSLFLLSLTWRAEATVTPERAEGLLHLLHQDCGSCHGLLLSGGLGPSLTSASIALKPKEFLVYTILEGRPGTAMPPWKPFLTREEAEWLVDYLQEPKGPEK